MADHVSVKPGFVSLPPSPKEYFERLEDDMQMLRAEVSSLRAEIDSLRSQVLGAARERG